MKKMFLVAAIATISGAASAADIVRGPSPFYAPAPAAYNWGGGYVGLNAGYEWGKDHQCRRRPGGSARRRAGRLQLAERRNSCSAAETDFQFTGADDTFAPYKFSNPWFGTLRGRVGYAMNNILVYGTLGLAYGELTGTLAGARRDQDPHRLDRRPRHGGRLHAELVGQGRISLHGSRRPRLHDHRRRTTAFKATCCASA